MNYKIAFIVAMVFCAVLLYKCFDYALANTILNDAMDGSQDVIMRASAQLDEDRRIIAQLRANCR